MDTVYFRKTNAKSLNTEVFKLFKREWILEYHWAGLSNAEKAVLVPLYAHTNKQGDAFPGRDRLANLSGVAPNTVTEALTKLSEREIFGINIFKVKASMRGVKYNFHIQQPQRIDQEQVFPIFNFLFDTNGSSICMWAKMLPTMKAIYIALRACGLPPEEMSLDKGMDREWEAVDIKAMGLDFLADIAGVSEKSVKRAIPMLKTLGLIKVWETHWTVRRQTGGQTGGQ